MKFFSPLHPRRSPYGPVRCSYITRSWNQIYCQEVPSSLRRLNSWRGSCDTAGAGYHGTHITQAGNLRLQGYTTILGTFDGDSFQGAMEA